MLTRPDPACWSEGVSVWLQPDEGTQIGWCVVGNVATMTSELKPGIDGGANVIAADVAESRG